MDMLDIDLFKRVNDTYGHAAGDNVLVHFADVVRARLDARHTFIRYGGEEFVVLCRSYDAVEAFHLAERIRQSVELSALLPGQRVTCSIGVSQWHNGEDDLESFYQRADQAMITQSLFCSVLFNLWRIIQYMRFCVNGTYYM